MHGNIHTATHAQICSWGYAHKEAYKINQHAFAHAHKIPDRKGIWLIKVTTDTYALKNILHRTTLIRFLHLLSHWLHHFGCWDLWLLPSDTFSDIDNPNKVVSNQSITSKDILALFSDVS